MTFLRRRPYSSTLHFFLTILFLCIDNSQEQEYFQAASLTVQDTLVSASTGLSFQCILNTAVIANSDYIIIKLPDQVAPAGGAVFKMNSGTSCSLNSPFTATCSVINITTAMIVIGNVTGSSSSQHFEGLIKTFINPDSVKVVSGISISLYGSSSNQIKATSLPITIASFQASSLTVTLLSSSIVVGAQNTALTITVKPDTLIKGEGRIILTVPEYFPNAGSVKMFSTTLPTCSISGANPTVSISIQGVCTFSPTSNQVQVPYVLSNTAVDTTSTITIILQNFNNPISTQPKKGFTVTTYDQSNNVIGLISGLTLSGITQPAPLTSTTLSLLDVSMVYEYSQLQLKLSFEVPIQQTCYVKIFFPQELGIDDKLTQISGTGIFQTQNGYFPDQQIDLVAKSIYFRACDIQYGGSTNVGIITFSKVRNPAQIKTSSSFKIIFAQDSSQTILVAQQSTDLVLQSTQLTPGSITSISMSTIDSSVVQTLTGYQSTFTTTHQLLPAQDSAIVIKFPTSIDMNTATSCSIVVPQLSPFDSVNIRCSFLDRQTVLIQNPFASTIGANTILSLSIYRGQNPISEQYTGAFTITTYNVIGGTRYMVDTGVSSGSLIKPQLGQISKSQSIQVTNDITYTKDQTYTFYLHFEHMVPKGGYFIIYLPLSGDIAISSSQLIRSTCKLVTLNRFLFCTNFNNDQAIRIEVDASNFPSGIATSSDQTIQISGLRNPRSKYPTSSFNITSYDSLGYRIDTSSLMDFNVSMSQSVNMTYFSAQMQNTTNGAISSYRITAQSPTPILQGDQLWIKLPQEMKISGNLTTCFMLLPSYIPASSIECSSQDTQTLIVKFSKLLLSIIIENQQFAFNVSYFQNPGSMKASSPFQEVYISSQRNNILYEIARYRRNDATVQTNTPARLSSFTLDQTNKDSQATSIYTLTFTPVNGIPSTGAIVIRAPYAVRVTNDQSLCYITLKQPITNVCKLTKSTITIENAFAGQVKEYTDPISITFPVTNPLTNINLQSFQLETYTDKNYLYMIDKTDSGILPQLNCNYPCMSCSASDPDFCTACFEGNLMPELVQRSPTNELAQTCVSECEVGYTPNGSNNPRTCMKCDPQCETCNQDNYPGDVSKCLTCSSSYPFFYEPKKTCYPKCNDGQFNCNRQQCCDCVAPCQTCYNVESCKTCNTLSTKPLMLGDKCVDKCPSGYTRVAFDCVQCNSPCSTCDAGAPSSCLTCDGSKSRQFLFGRECLSECPVGTIPDIRTNGSQSLCKGCKQGCDLCDIKNNAICLRCSKGLAILNNTCYSECPFNYVKSKDGGTVCELRGYLLDESLIYFPFASVGLVSIAICVTAYIVTRGKSLIISNAIAFVSMAEFGALLLQIYYSYMYQRQYMIITVASFSIFVIRISLNLAFLGFYCLKFQFSDTAFDHWRQKNFSIIATVLLLSGTISFHVFRLLYSRLFGLNCFSASIEQKLAFTRKVQMFGMIAILLYNLPLVILDALILFYLDWGSQLYITCAESGGLTFIVAVLNVFDNCCRCSRLSNKDEEEFEQVNIRRKKANLDDQQSYHAVIDGEGPEGSGGDSRLLLNDTAKERFQRERLLRGLLSTVNFNKELHLQDLDRVTDEDSADDFERGPRRRIQSFEDVMCLASEELKGTDERMIHTFSYGQRNAYLRQQKKRRLVRGGSTTRNRGQIMSLNEFRNSIAGGANFTQRGHLMFNFNNVYAEAKQRASIQSGDEETERADSQGEPEDAGPRTIEMQIQTEEKDKFGLNRIAKGRNKRQLDDIIREGSKESFEVELKQSVAEELKHLKKRSSAQTKKRGQATKSYYFTQLDQESNLNISDNISVLDNDSQRVSLLGSKKPKLQAREEDQVEEEDDDIIDSNEDQKGTGTAEQSHSKSTKSKKSKSSKQTGTAGGGTGTAGNMASSSDKLTTPSKKPIKPVKTSPVGSKAESSQQHSPSNDNEYESSQKKMTLNTDVKQSTAKQSNKKQKLSMTSGSKQKQHSSFKSHRKIPRRSKDRSGRGSSEDSDHIKEEDSYQTSEKKSRSISKSRKRSSSNQKDSKKRSSSNQSRSHSHSGSTSKKRQSQDSRSRKSGSKKSSRGKSSGGSGEPVSQTNSIKAVAMLPKKEYFHQRAFNINDVMGDLNQQIDPETQSHDSNHRPIDIHGYLVSEDGSILNKYNFNVMFFKSELTPEGDIPMPYRYECYNFNPHEIIGNFDYDQASGKPIILKSRKTGKLVDKNLRHVNKFGFLIDNEENIIDNEGRIKITKNNVKSNGDLPFLLNLEGKAFDIRTIMGRFDKHPITKQIIFPEHDSYLIDKLNRRVNQAGYLVDQNGNIVYKGTSKIVFTQEQLMFNEPPKLFDFMKFDISQIQGQKLNLAATKNRPSMQINGDLISISDKRGVESEVGNGPKINELGYLVDALGNIIDQFGNTVFKKEILQMVKHPLSNKMIQAEIPIVFRDPQLLLLQEQVSDTEIKSQHTHFSHAMMDENEYLKTQLDQIQEKMIYQQLGAEVSPKQKQPLNNDLVEIKVINDQMEVDDAEEEKKSNKAESESGLDNEILMFSEEANINNSGVKDYIQGLSLLNERPDPQAQVMVKNRISKKQRPQPHQQRLAKKALQAAHLDPRSVSNYLPQINPNRSSSNLHLRQYHEKPQSNLNRTGSALLGQAVQVNDSTQNISSLLQRHVLHNKFMIEQPSEASMASYRNAGNRKSTSGIRIMQNDSVEIGQDAMPMDDPALNDNFDQDEYDDEDTVFKKNFDSGAQYYLEKRRKLNNNSRSKSSQNRRLKMYDVGSMMDLINYNNERSQSSLAGGNKTSKLMLRESGIMHERIKGLQNIYLQSTAEQMRHSIGIPHSQGRAKIKENHHAFGLDYPIIEDQDMANDNNNSFTGQPLLHTGEFGVASLITRRNNFAQ